MGVELPIRRLLEGSGLGSDEVDRLCCAFEQALRVLNLVDRNDPVTELIAKKIIDLGKNGGEPAEIAQRAIKAFGIDQ